MTTTTRCDRCGNDDAVLLCSQCKIDLCGACAELDGHSPDDYNPDDAKADEGTD